MGHNARTCGRNERRVGRKTSNQHETQATGPQVNNIVNMPPTDQERTGSKRSRICSEKEQDVISTQQSITSFGRGMGRGRGRGKPAASAPPMVGSGRGIGTGRGKGKK
ncbi:hypothetical protein CDL12_01229 [Handroanthus impetiginosus]|uniref:Uncharacterized protein n=1 Tax=Handroanthus impetiginosus TaxID=429701 RepID=A0A2G9I8F4_9LAMI|nr:hypothetical protein CDL12_01229 [Handroanthus impetiginosus]